MASTYKAILLASRPTGDINPSEQFKLVTNPRPTESSLKDNEVLVENIYLSIDAAMRSWMNGNRPPFLDGKLYISDSLPPQDARSYMPPVPLGAPMRGLTISRVLGLQGPSLCPGEPRLLRWQLGRARGPAR